MSEERKQILTMVAEGKISVEEAEKLMTAVGEFSGGSSAGGSGKTPRYLRVVVNEGSGEKVNIRVPMQLIRAGVKMGALLPEDACSHVQAELTRKGMNIDLSKIKPDDVDEFIASLSELTVDVNDDGEKVRVFCE